MGFRVHGRRNYLKRFSLRRARLSSIFSFRFPLSAWAYASIDIASRKKETKLRLRASGRYVTVRLGRFQSDVGMLSELQKGEYDFPFVGPVTRILDVGSNIGASALYFKARYPDALIACIEPDRENFCYLTRNLSQVPGVIFLNMAVSDKCSVRSLENTQGGAAGRRLAEGPVTSGDTISQVATSSIPKILSLLGWSSVDLVKIDIEGGEIEALANSAEWASSINNVVIETHERHRFGCESAASEFARFFSYVEQRNNVVYMTRG